MAKVKKKKDDVYVDIPWLNNLLTIAFVACVVQLVYYLNTRAWDGSQQLTELAVSLVSVGFLIHASKFVGRTIFCLVANEQNDRNKRKFADQYWQLMIHAGMGAYEVFLLHPDGPENAMAWVWDTNLCYLGPGGAFNEPAGEWLERLYTIQTAIWIVTAVSHRWFDAKHKDYYVMFAHHVLTIFLVTFSWRNNLRLGMLVLAVHDLSDIGVDLLKLFNYAKSSLTEAVFVVHLICWIFFRLYVFPFYLVQSAIFESDAPCVTTPVRCILLRSALVGLQIMHIWWTYLFIRIMIGGCNHKAGAEVYEGDSDVEESTNSDKED